MTKILQEHFDISLYNDEFFKWHKDNTHIGEVEAGKVLAKWFNLKSIVDIGCGIGSYLQGSNCPTIKGFEIGGDDAKRYTDASIIDFIDFNTDATKPMEFDVKFDCCICLEVAEHIETSKSEQLVTNITNASNFIVFSAAPIGQEGCGHINCQPFEFWVKLFEKKGFQLDVFNTEQIKNIWLNKAPQYVINNLMVFSNE